MTDENGQLQPADEGRLDLRVRPKLRLWVVRVVREAYVLAADENEARDAQGDIEQWEAYPEVEAYKWGGEKLGGWTDDCFVYANGDKNVTLATAKEVDAAA